MAPVTNDLPKKVYKNTQEGCTADGKIDYNTTKVGLENKGFTQTYEDPVGDSNADKTSPVSEKVGEGHFKVAEWLETQGDTDSEDTWTPGSKLDPFRKYRIGRQVLLVSIWICIGLYAEIVGPTLPDLKDKLGVNYEVVSQALVGKSVGGVIGAILGGFLHERYIKHTELLMAIGLFLGASATIATPFSVTLGMLAAMFALNGLGEGLINAGGNTMVMHLWGERAAAPMHSLHFGFGLGALIAPQVAQPFLSPDATTDDDVITTIAPWATTDEFRNSTSAPPGVSRIEIPYGIIGGMVAIFGFVVVALYLKGPPVNFPIRTPNTTFKTMLTPASCGKGFLFFGLELLVCLFIYFMQVAGGERAYGKFLFSFAVESDVQFSKKDASNLQTAFWGSFTAGRLLGIPIASCVSASYMIIGDAIGGTITAIMLAIYAYDNRLALWICSCFMGLFISVAFPNGMSWANNYLDMNSVGVMTLMVGSSFGGFLYQYLGGYLFERNPQYLMYLMVGYGGAMILSFIVMQSLATVHGKKIAARLRETEKESQDSYVIVVSGQGEKPAAYTVDTYM